MFDHLPNSRSAAIAVGSKYFFSGEPCVYGHLEKRNINGGCNRCLKLRQKPWVKRRMAEGVGFGDALAEFALLPRAQVVAQVVPTAGQSAVGNGPRATTGPAARFEDLCRLFQRTDTLYTAKNEGYEAEKAKLQERYDFALARLEEAHNKLLEQHALSVARVREQHEAAMAQFEEQHEATVVRLEEQRQALNSAIVAARRRLNADQQLADERAALIAEAIGPSALEKSLEWWDDFRRRFKFTPSERKAFQENVKALQAQQAKSSREWFDYD